MNERILVIDDEPWVHEVVRAYLEREGFIVYGASDGREGMELVRAHDGRIDAESKPGHGSRFIVTLPPTRPNRNGSVLGDKLGLES